VWALGGGKGGVGKSVITANLGVALARRAQRVVVLDADLGGANLHTLLGMANPGVTLSDFITRRVPALTEVMVPTPVDNLWLISGAKAVLEMANPKHAQKLKLLRHIRHLDVDHVLLDLSAGSSFNILDFFIHANHGILVVVPEPTSIENAYHFLKAAFYRRLKRAQPRDRVRQVINLVMNDRERRSIRSPRDLITQAMIEDPLVGQALQAEADGFTPSVLVNRVQLPEHRHLGDEISTACRDYFGSTVRCLGHLDSDTLVPRSVQQRRPATELFPSGPFSRSIDDVAHRLVSPSGSR